MPVKGTGFPERDVIQVGAFLAVVQNVGQAGNFS